MSHLLLTVHNEYEKIVRLLYPLSSLHFISSQAAAQMIKASMDKKFGASWHCCIGEGFGFEITYQSKNMIYVYYGTIGILAYKC